MTRRAAESKRSFKTRWFGPPRTEDATVDQVADLYDELSSPRGPFWTSEAERARRLPEEVRSQLAAMQAELEASSGNRRWKFPRPS